MATLSVKGNNPKGKILILTAVAMSDDQVEELLTQAKEHFLDTHKGILVSNHDIQIQTLCDPKDCTHLVSAEDIDPDETEELKDSIEKVSDNGAIVTNFQVTGQEV
jgi:hypothetical protein